MMVIVFNKPYAVLCQFTDAGNRPTLKNFIDIPGLYPAGRLDFDSEGLVVLTDDGWLQHRISDPGHKLPKTYWVQVEGEPGPEALTALRQGLRLRDGLTRPARVRIMNSPELWSRTPPIRERRIIPTRWVELTVSEGRNRQVRRMTAAVGFPTLRLIRVTIGPWQLGNLMPGHYRETEIPADWIHSFQR